MSSPAKIMVLEQIISKRTSNFDSVTEISCTHANYKKNPEATGRLLRNLRESHPFSTPISI